MRVPITRHDNDGTVIDGTAETADNGTIWDFRDLNGDPLPLPGGSRFVIPLDGA